MKDSKVMSLDTGTGNELIKSTLNARKPENAINDNLKKHFGKALKNYRMLHGGPYPTLNTGSGPNLDPETGGKIRKEEKDKFSPVIKTVLRSSNIMRRKNIMHVRSPDELEKQVAEIEEDQNLEYKLFKK